MALAGAVDDGRDRRRRRDKTRPSRIARLPTAVHDRTVALTLTAPPAEVTHWTAAMMAKALGISVSSVQSIWRAHGLQPHRVRQFKLSGDPQFAAKLRDIVGLYVDPPAHAVVSLHEKSQIQALDRTQPGLALKRGRCGTMIHDYKRHGTTTLFAALNVLEGKVIGRCMQRHRHQEFYPVSQYHCKFRSFRQAISVQTGRRFRWKPTGRFGPKRHPVADGFWSRLWRTAAA